MMLDLKERLEDEVSRLPQEYLDKYNELHVSPFAARFRRNLSLEDVIVVARRGKKVIFFDEVEDEFCQGVLERNGIVTDWGFIGSLHAALNYI